MARHQSPCPDCGQPIFTRSSQREHVLMQVQYLYCSNVACGSTFKATREITHRMSPSALPNPAIDLPMADAAMRRHAVLAAMAEEDKKQLDMVDQLASDDEQQAGENA